MIAFVCSFNITLVVKFIPSDSVIIFPQVAQNHYVKKKINNSLSLNKGKNDCDGWKSDLYDK